MEAMNFTREQLAQYILNNAKDSVLAKLKAIIEKEEKNDIVAYTVDGRALTLEQFQNELEEAEKEIERGEYLTSDELVKEIATWK
ncbi:MAG: hypothetical protein JSS94_07010 [Bacteroidetes bacterium]|nr:hypothetical protein [Bacteroidota bacterium]